MATLAQQRQALMPYVQRGLELDSSFPLIAYYCRLFGVTQVLSLNAPLLPEVSSVVSALLTTLEENRQSLQLNEADDARTCESFALAVFRNADRADRQLGRRDAAVARNLYAAHLFLKMLAQFGPLKPAIETKMTYASWRATVINKALRAGEEPPPPPVQEGEDGEQGAVRDLQAFLDEQEGGRPGDPRAGGGNEGPPQTHPALDALPDVPTHAPTGPPAGAGGLAGQETGGPGPADRSPWGNAAPEPSPAQTADAEPAPSTDAPSDPLPYPGSAPSASPSDPGAPPASSYPGAPTPPASSYPGAPSPPASSYPGAPSPPASSYPGAPSPPASSDAAYPQPYPQPSADAAVPVSPESSAAAAAAEVAAAAVAAAAAAEGEGARAGAGRGAPSRGSRGRSASRSSGSRSASEAGASPSRSPAGARASPPRSPPPREPSSGRFAAAAEAASLSRFGPTPPPNAPLGAQASADALSPESPPRRFQHSFAPGERVFRRVPGRRVAEGGSVLQTRGGGRAPSPSGEGLDRPRSLVLLDSAPGSPVWLPDAELFPSPARGDVVLLFEAARGHSVPVVVESVDPSYWPPAVIIRDGEDITRFVALDDVEAILERAEQDQPWTGPEQTHTAPDDRWTQGGAAPVSAPTAAAGEGGGGFSAPAPPPAAGEGGGFPASASSGRPDGPAEGSHNPFAEPDAPNGGYPALSPSAAVYPAAGADRAHGSGAFYPARRGSASPPPPAHRGAPDVEPSGLRVEHPAPPALRAQAPPAPAPARGDYQPSLQDIADAHKDTRSAASALSFEDIPTAIQLLEHALNKLKGLA